MIPLGVLGSARRAAAAALTVTHLSNHIDNNNATTRTFASVSLGDAVARTILVSVAFRVSSGGDTATVTVAGFPATIDAKVTGHAAAAIARVALPGSVTSGDIVVTSNSSAVALSVYVTAAPIALHHAVANASINNWVTSATAPTLNTVAGGFALAAFGNTGNVATHTWTGLTERYDASNYTTADTATTGSTITASVTSSTGVLYSGIAAAAYAAA